MVKKSSNNERNDERERANAFSMSYWTECSLSGSELHAPILVAPNKSLFNKEDVLQAILNHTIPKRLRFIKKLKNMTELNLGGAKNLVSYMCPISGKSPSPGTVDLWVVIKPCGHVFLRESLVQIKAHECPVCSKEFQEDDILELSPTP